MDGDRTQAQILRFAFLGKGNQLNGRHSSGVAFLRRGKKQNPSGVPIFRFCLFYPSKSATISRDPEKARQAKQATVWPTNPPQNTTWFCFFYVGCVSHARASLLLVEGRVFTRHAFFPPLSARALLAPKYCSMVGGQRCASICWAGTFEKGLLVVQEPQEDTATAALGVCSLRQRCGAVVSLLAALQACFVRPALAAL